jgi:hypothetical protein
MILHPPPNHGSSLLLSDSNKENVFSIEEHQNGTAERIDQERRVHRTVVQGVLAEKRIQKALNERQQSTTSGASTNEIKSLRQIEAGVGGAETTMETTDSR